MDLELKPLKQLGKRIKLIHQREMEALADSYKNKAGGNAQANASAEAKKLHSHRHSVNSAGANAVSTA